MYSQADRIVLTEMLNLINQRLGSNIYYLAELIAYKITGVSDIVKSYIYKFDSQAVRAYLLPLLIADRPLDCGEMVFQLYLCFRESKEYIASQGMPAPASIYTRYDNAFRELKSKRLQSRLVDILSNPRDAYYLPLTIRMVASWSPNEFCDILQKYALGSSFTAKEVGILCDDCSYFPSFSTMVREVQLSAIACLKYYPTAETIRILTLCAQNVDMDISKAAKKSLKTD